MTAERIVYGDSRSGNCYKIRMLAAELGIDYEWRELDILAGDTRRLEFLEMNPNGKIPVLELPGRRYLAESNAILCYLAEGTAFAGSDDFTRARILQWLFFEQYSHEPYIATSRFIIKYLGNPREKRAALDEKREPGYRALDIMETQLAGGSYFLGGDQMTLADIALYAYMHVADEGGFDLGRFPAIQRWLELIQGRDAYVPMVPPGS